MNAGRKPRTDSADREGKIHIELGGATISTTVSDRAYFPEEAHGTLQICIPMEGAVYEVMRGAAQGGLHRSLHTEAQVGVFAIGQPHAIEWRERAGVVTLHFSQDFLARALGEQALLARLERDNLCCCDPLLLHAARTFRAELQAGQYFSPAYLESFATIVAYRVASTGSELPSKGPRLSAAQMAAVEGLIRSHLDGALSVSALAARAGQSLYHFIRCFKASFGATPHAYITRLRVLHARKLLESTDMTVAVVALEVGMSQSQLARAFAAQVGITPADYRRGLR